MSDKAWINNLEPGSKVVVRSFGQTVDFLEIVQRVTKTLVILSGNRKFRKSNGYMITSSKHNRPFIVEPTDNSLKPIVAKSCKNIFSKIDLESMGLDQLYDLEKQLKKLITEQGKK